MILRGIWFELWVEARPSLAAGDGPEDLVYGLITTGVADYQGKGEAALAGKALIDLEFDGIAYFQNPLPPNFISAFVNSVSNVSYIIYDRNSDRLFRGTPFAVDSRLLAVLCWDIRLTPPIQTQIVEFVP